MVFSWVLLICFFLVPSSAAKAGECKHYDAKCQNTDECCSKSCLDGSCQPSQTEGTVCAKESEHDCAIATGYMCIDGKCRYIGECNFFGEECKASYECCSERCDNQEKKCKCAKKAGYACGDNDDCCKPLVCINEKCETCRKSGTQCKNPSECCSNKCDGKCACSKITETCLTSNDCCKAHAGELEVVCQNGKCQKCLVPTTLDSHIQTLEGECVPGISRENCCTKKCLVNNYCTRLADGANCEVNGNCDSGNCWKGKCAHVAYGLDKDCFKENENCPDKASGKGACCGKFVCTGGKCTIRKNVSCGNSGVCNTAIDKHGNEKSDTGTQYQQQSTIG